MKRSKLLAAGILAAAAILPGATVPAVAPVIAQQSPASRQNAATPALPTANANAITLYQLIGDGVNLYGIQLAPVWPHNRPQPGWRKVQSRARHAEGMRRQRRNA